MIFYAKSKELKLVPDNTKEWLDYLISMDGQKLVLDIKKETGVRTDDQNRSLHLYYEHLAQALNEAGHTFKFQLGDKTVELDWDKDLIKQNIWKPIQKALTGKGSTKNLDKVSEIDRIYDHLNRFFSAKPFFIHVPFPSEETKPKEVETKIDYPENNQEDIF